VSYCAQQRLTTTTLAWDFFRLNSLQAFLQGNACELLSRKKSPRSGLVDAHQCVGKESSKEAVRHQHRHTKILKGYVNMVVRAQLLLLLTKTIGDMNFFQESAWETVKSEEILS